MNVLLAGPRGDRRHHILCQLGRMSEGAHIDIRRKDHVGRALHQNRFEDSVDGRQKLRGVQALSRHPGIGGRPWHCYGPFRLWHARAKGEHRDACQHSDRYGTKDGPQSSPTCGGRRPADSGATSQEVAPYSQNTWAAESIRPLYKERRHRAHRTVPRPAQRVLRGRTRGCGSAAPRAHGARLWREPTQWLAFSSLGKSAARLVDRLPPWRLAIR